MFTESQFFQQLKRDVQVAHDALFAKEAEFQLQMRAKASSDELRVLMLELEALLELSNAAHQALLDHVSSGHQDSDFEFLESRRDLERGKDGD